MADKDRLLPEACEDCVVYRGEESRCHRHAVSPMEAGFGVMEPEPVVWPQVSPTDHCGAGGDRRQPGELSLVTCGSCLYWHRPGGQGVKPKYGHGRKHRNGGLNRGIADHTRRILPLNVTDAWCGAGLRIDRKDAGMDLTKARPRRTRGRGRDERDCLSVPDEDEGAVALTALAQNVITARHTRGWTQEDLSAAADITQQQISLIERGGGNPTIRTLARLAEAFGTTVEALLRG
jgi:DNA-binding XRE family transcriptional regulator